MPCTMHAKTGGVCHKILRTGKDSEANRAKPGHVKQSTARQSQVPEVPGLILRPARYFVSPSTDVRWALVS